MRVGSLAALFALLIGAAAYGAGGGASSETPRASRFRPPEKSLLGIVWERNSAELARLDPRTLAPGSRRATVGQGTTIAFSPNGETIALASTEHPEIDLVDVKTLRSLGTVELGVPGYVSRLSWTPSGMLFAAVGQQLVVEIDPVGRKVYEARQVDGTLIAAQSIKAGLLGLVAPADRIGPLKLVVWGGKGTASVPLRMVGGWETDQGEDESDFRAREMVPGLAVQPNGRRALVVSAGGPVAEVDLSNLGVTYHTLSEPVSLLHRLLGWLDPAAEAKMIEGKERRAVWLTNGLVAVSGVDYPPIEPGQSELAGKPIGLSLIDTSDWSIRTIDGKVEGVLLAGEHLLGFEAGCSGGSESLALVGYDLRGKERFRFCRNEGFDPVVVGGYAYVGFEDNTRFEIHDLETGAIVARLRTRQTTTILVDD